MVEEILLRVTVMWREMFSNERIQTGRFWFSAREIKLAKRFKHPGIDGKCLRKTVGEKENTIGDLGSNSGKLKKLGLGGFVIGNM